MVMAGSTGKKRRAARRYPAAELRSKNAVKKGLLVSPGKKWLQEISAGPALRLSRVLN